MQDTNASKMSKTKKKEEHQSQHNFSRKYFSMFFQASQDFKISKT